jgi:hypothetical protein
MLYLAIRLPVFHHNPKLLQLLFKYSRKEEHNARQSNTKARIKLNA